MLLCFFLHHFLSLSPFLLRSIFLAFSFSLHLFFISFTLSLLALRLNRVVYHRLICLFHFALFRLYVRPFSSYQMLSTLQFFLHVSVGFYRHLQKAMMMSIGIFDAFRQRKTVKENRMEGRKKDRTLCVYRVCITYCCHQNHSSFFISFFFLLL